MARLRTDRERVISALVELVEALDRRVPHVERVGETHIAHDAAALRQQATRRIDELKSTQPADAIKPSTDVRMDPS